MFKKTLLVITLIFSANSAFSMNPAPAAPAAGSSTASTVAGIAIIAAASLTPAAVAKGGCVVIGAAWKYVIVPGSVYLASAAASAASKALSK